MLNILCVSASAQSSFEDGHLLDSAELDSML